MATPDILPASDSDFDTLQAILVAAVITHAITWNIPAGEITKLTDKQTIWAAAWLIAKDKQNSTTAQKKAKDLARKAYAKVLRVFIQKWIYRNESMDAADIEECGLKPHDTSHTPATKPEATTVKLERGATSELISRCLAIKGAKYYGCIMTEGAPLPDNFFITPDGRIIAPVGKPLSGGMESGSELTGFQIDLTSQREKHFTGLKPGSTYYFYYYVVNSAGVSPLSTVVSIMCW